MEMEIGAGSGEYICRGCGICIGAQGAKFVLKAVGQDADKASSRYSVLCPACGSSAGSKSRLLGTGSGFTLVRVAMRTSTSGKSVLRGIVKGRRSRA